MSALVICPAKCLFSTGKLIINDASWSSRATRIWWPRFPGEDVVRLIRVGKLGDAERQLIGLIPHQRRVDRCVEIRTSVVEIAAGIQPVDLTVGDRISRTIRPTDLEHCAGVPIDDLGNGAVRRQMRADVLAVIAGLGTLDRTITAAPIPISANGFWW